MKFSRDGWLAIGIVLSLVLVTSAAVLQQTKEVDIPYTSTSSAPDGVLALKTWLNDLGYHAVETSAAFNPDESIKTIFILQPLELISENDWKLVDHWVEHGGVLVLAGDNPQTGIAMGHFKFSMALLQAGATEILPVAPVLNSPSLVSKISVKTDLGISTTRTDFTPLVSAQGSPIIVSFEDGMGRVILASTPYIFSNLALKDDGIAVLVLNIIALTGKKGPVWFDEWHHGFQTEMIVGPWQWLQSTPGGHAMLFVVGMLFVTLILQGRTFGRPVPLTHEIKKRGPLEHVTAIANLNRKAGHSSEVLKQYHQHLKRHLGRRYRLDPTLDDEEYVNLLSQYNPAIDKNALGTLLRRLSQKAVSEAELLKLASEATRLMND